MRTILRGLWILGTLGMASHTALGCKAPCSETDSCGSYVPPEGGGGDDAGASGTAGTPAGGSSGNGGASGRAGAGSSASGSAGMSAAGTAGESEGGAAGSGGAACDTTQNPSTESCLVDDDHAVFVAPTGKDSAAGTKRAPVATLSRAVQLAAGSKFVLVCDATYDEHVTVTMRAQIYGGFKCTDWSAESGTPLFKPTTAGPALKIDTVTEPVAISRLNFEVGDATSNGETALTALVNASPAVTFESVSLKAGKGKAGAIGALTAFTYPDPGTLNGNAETVAGSGGTSKTCVCQATRSSTGGVGGTPVAGGQNGSTGQPNNGSGNGGTPGSCGTTGTGNDGADGPDALPGSGASALGLGTSDGWKPSSGLDGIIGTPGQGGGGGASRNDLGHGGGGGCGGCGGNGATAGKGGGGSIALLLINAPIVLQSSTLITADAGDGGGGHVGQGGQSDIGAGGGVVSSINSCPGGNGGKGGDGGASGGGAGGISVGILWKGAMAPTLMDTMTTTGKAGAAGVGGVPGTNDGIAGLKQDLLQVP